MKHAELAEMTRGWFVGDFEPTMYRTGSVEVGVKTYVAGDREAPHLHKIATEITVIVSGTARMAGRTLGPGSIVTIEPGEVSTFEALEDVVLVAVKLPGATDDKYAADE